jgi:hypothetical protein
MSIIFKTHLDHFVYRMGRMAATLGSRARAGGHVAARAGLLAGIQWSCLRTSDDGEQILAALTLSKFLQKARTEEGYQHFNTINPR